MVKVLLADDHGIVRKGIKALIESGSDMCVVAEASTGAEAISMVNEHVPEVVILDLSMPGRNGLEVLKDIKKSHPGIPVIVLSMHPEDQYAVRAFRAGAAGYMTKESATEELVSAIHLACSGGKYISPSVAELLANYVQVKDIEEKHKLLSDREFEVFNLLASGVTVGDIADRLNLSVKTISTYRTRILEKMSMRTNADMASYAREFKLL